MRRHSLGYLTAYILTGILCTGILALCVYGLINRYLTPRMREATFRIQTGQRLFILARDDWTDNWTGEDDDGDESREHMEADTRAERLAAQEFARNGRVILTEKEKDANFVFLVVIDPRGGKDAVLGEIVTPGCGKSSSGAAGQCESRWTGWGASPQEVVLKFYKEVLW